MDSILVYCVDNLNKPDTLRYFYSSVFQGFAAILAVSSTFMLYIFQRFSDTKNVLFNLLEEAKGSLPKEYLIKHIDEYEKVGMYKFIKNHHNDPEFNINESYKSNSEKIEILSQLDEFVTELKKMFPKVLIKSIYILVISLLGLYFIDYNVYLNIGLSIIGLILIFLSIEYFKELYSMIKLVLLTHHSD